MAEVTFPENIGGDGKTYSDDADPNTGMENGGHRERFIPALANIVGIGVYVQGRADALDGIREAVEGDRQAAEDAAQGAETLYGSLEAVQSAQQAAEGAASDAGTQREAAETARQGAEDAQGEAEQAVQQIEQEVGQAITAHEAEEDPHSQYAKTTEVDSAIATRLAIADVVDGLTSSAADKPLSANQGRVLKGLVDSINSLLQSEDANLDELQEIVDYIKLNREDLETLSISSIAGLQDALDGKAPTVHDHDERYYTRDQIADRDAWTLPADNTSFTYDGDGAITELTESVGGEIRTTTYTYNGDGLLTEVQVEFRGMVRTETFTYVDEILDESTAVITEAA